MVGDGKLVTVAEVSAPTASETSRRTSKAHLNLKSHLAALLEPHPCEVDHLPRPQPKCLDHPSRHEDVVARRLPVKHVAVHVVQAALPRIARAHGGLRSRISAFVFIVLVVVVRRVAVLVVLPRRNLSYLELPRRNRLALRRLQRERVHSESAESMRAC